MENFELYNSYINKIIFFWVIHKKQGEKNRTKVLLQCVCVFSSKNLKVIGRFQQALYLIPVIRNVCFETHLM